MPLFETPPLQEIEILADNRHAGGVRAMPPRDIIIHATAGTNSLKWLTTDTGSNVSVHFLIPKDGRLLRLVPDNRTAYHVGYGHIGTITNLNPTTLGVELENLNNGTDPYTDEQYRALTRLVLHWWSLYGFLPFFGHAEVDTKGKTDPKGFDWGRFNALLLAGLFALPVPRDIREELIVLDQILVDARNDASTFDHSLGNARTLIAGLLAR